MTAELTLRGGRLALPTGIVEGDLQVVAGKIAQIGTVDQDRGEVIDCRGLLVMPGVIDPQVHFREPGFPHKEDLGSGSRACAAGGVTSFLEMPNTTPPTTSEAALADKLARARAKSLVNYGFFVGATLENAETVSSIEGACGVKVFMGSSTGTLLLDEQAGLERLFAHGRRLVAVHAEDETRLRAQKERFADRKDVAAHSELRDAETALIATKRAVDLSLRHQRRLHVLHLSTGDEVEFLRTVSADWITAETTPQHLLLSAPEVYQRLGTKAQMNPPLRTRQHAEILWRGLHDGTIACIATDHAPHTLEEKAQPYGVAPSGMPGVETALPAMLDAAQRGFCSVEQVVRWMTDAPARCYGMVDKGRLEVGFDADLALIDLGLTRRVEDRPIQSRCGWNPFEGLPLTGWPVATFVLGIPVYRDGEVLPVLAGRPIRFRSP